MYKCTFANRVRDMCACGLVYKKKPEREVITPSQQNEVIVKTSGMDSYIIMYIYMVELVLRKKAAFGFDGKSCS